MASRDRSCPTIVPSTFGEEYSGWLFSEEGDVIPSSFPSEMEYDSDDSNSCLFLGTTEAGKSATPLRNRARSTGARKSNGDATFLRSCSSSYLSLPSNKSLSNSMVEESHCRVLDDTCDDAEKFSRNPDDAFIEDPENPESHDCSMLLQRTACKPLEFFLALENFEHVPVIPKVRAMSIPLEELEELCQTQTDAANEEPLPDFHSDEENLECQSSSKSRKTQSDRALHSPAKLASKSSSSGGNNFLLSKVKVTKKSASIRSRTKNISVASKDWYAKIDPELLKLAATGSGKLKRRASPAAWKPRRPRKSKVMMPSKYRKCIQMT